MEEWIKVNDDVWQKQAEIDWEQRRYEIAKDVLTALILDPTTRGGCDSYSKVAVKYADALIKELTSSSYGVKR